MGACDYFNDIKTDKPVGEAFLEVVEQAQWEHGHGGYSGTIAEKGMDGYILVDIPAGVSAYDFKDALHELSYSTDDSGEHFDPAKIGDGLEKQLLDRMGERELLHLCNRFNDKWGPAIAVKTDGGWAFFGSASY